MPKYPLRVPTKISEKSAMIFPWLLQISRQTKYHYLFLPHMYQFVSITDRHRRTLTHTWFDQGQPAIQLILLVIELIQEVKTTLANLIKRVKDFPIHIWKTILISHFHKTLCLILPLSYFNIRESILMQLTQLANNFKNASDHCCDQFFLCVLIT